MLEYVIAIFSLVLVIVISIVGYFYIQQIKQDNWDSIQNLVHEINEKKKVEYDFEKNQVNNVKLAGSSIHNIANSMEDMRNNINALNNTTIKYGDDLMATGLLPDENGYVSLSAAGDPRVLIDPKTDNIFLRGNVYLCNPLGQNCKKMSAQ